MCLFFLVLSPHEGETFTQYLPLFYACLDKYFDETKPNEIIVVHIIYDQFILVETSVTTMVIESKCLKYRSFTPFKFKYK